MLHGFLTDHRIWSSVCALQRLQDRFFIVVPDLRGHGESQCDAAADTVCRDSDGPMISAVLIDKNELDAAVVVAWSYAGRMVLDYARYFGTDDIAGIQYVAAASLSETESLGPAHTCLADLCSAEPPVQRQAVERFITDVLAIATDSQAAALVREMVGQVGAPMRALLRARPLDYDKIVAGLRLPQMWINGCEDPIVRPTRAHAIALLQPTARVSLYDAARHAPFLEYPDRFADELIDFGDASSSETENRIEGA